MDVGLLLPPLGVLQDGAGHRVERTVQPEVLSLIRLLLLLMLLVLTLLSSGDLSGQNGRLVLLGLLWARRVDHVHSGVHGLGWVVLEGC